MTYRIGLSLPMTVELSEFTLHTQLPYDMKLINYHLTKSLYDQIATDYNLQVLRFIGIILNKAFFFV